MLEECKRGRGQGHVALNANSFKTFEATNFKFGTHAPRENPVMTNEKIFFEKGRVQGHVTP